MKRTLFLSLGLLLVSLQAAGHEGSLSLTLSKKQVQSGDRIELRIAGLEEGESVAFTLLGPLGAHPLGEVRIANQQADFRTEVTIPAGIKSGSYILKAEAGSHAVSVSLRVVAGSEPLRNAERQEATPHEEPEGHRHSPKGEEEHQMSVQPLQLQREWRSTEKAVAWGLIAVAGIVGSLLWYRN